MAEIFRLQLDDSRVVGELKRISVMCLYFHYPELFHFWPCIAMMFKNCACFQRLNSMRVKCSAFKHLIRRDDLDRIAV
eukprot:scaffold135800_cov19-Prasinocladus_malaysianus.AAC.1